MARKKKSAAPEAAQPSNGFVAGATGSFIPALDDPMGKYDVNTSAEKVYKRNWLLRIVAIIVGVILLLLGIGFGCVSVMNHGGRFTVSMSNNSYGIQLSATPDFDSPTLQLHGEAIENLDNISKTWLLNKNGELGSQAPVYESYADLEKVYGSHNVYFPGEGEEKGNGAYFAYTFFVRNAGEEVNGKDATVDYMTTLKVVSVNRDVNSEETSGEAVTTKAGSFGADEAMRVMVFINGEPTVYAKPKFGTDNVKEFFAADENFVSDKTVMEYVRRDFGVDTVDRYTVVIWLEGEDPECVNDIMAGEVKLKMEFDVIEKLETE